MTYDERWTTARAYCVVATVTDDPLIVWTLIESACSVLSGALHWDELAAELEAN